MRIVCCVFAAKHLSPLIGRLDGKLMRTLSFTAGRAGICFLFIAQSCIRGRSDELHREQGFSTLYCYRHRKEKLSRTFAEGVPSTFFAICKLRLGAEHVIEKKVMTIFNPRSGEGTLPKTYDSVRESSDHSEHDRCSSRIAGSTKRGYLRGKPHESCFKICKPHDLVRSADSRC
jgi:hypothetical protein